MNYNKACKDRIEPKIISIYIWQIVHSNGSFMLYLCVVLFFDTIRLEFVYALSPHVGRIIFKKRRGKEFLRLDLKCVLHLGRAIIR